MSVRVKQQQATTSPLNIALLDAMLAVTLSKSRVNELCFRLGYSITDWETPSSTLRDLYRNLISASQHDNQLENLRDNLLRVEPRTASHLASTDFAAQLVVAWETLPAHYGDALAHVVLGTWQVALFKG
jgi:hypothetical protein